MILDLSVGVAGAFCARMLQQIGNEAVRVAPEDSDTDTAMAWANSGKRLIDRDPATVDGLEWIRQHLTEMDCLVEDRGPGGLEALGLTEAALREATPGLVLVRISEFGQTGPLAGNAGSELVNLAAGGMLFLTGTWDRPPVQLAPYQAQLTAGLLAALAAAAALLAGDSREGVTVDLSKQEAVLALINPALSEYAYSGTIPARDGTVAAMARIEQAKDTFVYAGPGAAANADYQRYSTFLGIPEFAEARFATAEGRMDNWQEHQRLLQPKLRERTAQEWTEAAAEHRLTFGLAQTSLDLLDCPVLNERGFFEKMDMPRTKIATGTARAPRGPYLVNGERPGVTNAEPGETR